MDGYQIRKIPGIGFKISHLVEDLVLSRTTEAIPHDDEHSAKVRTRDVLAHPDMSPELLEKILGGPGSERGIGQKVWNLLHGVDNTEVKEASDVPTQISIEDTYVTKTINTPSELMRELRALSTSLVKRMHLDLLDEDPTAETPGTQKWLAHPKTLRLSTRVKSKPGPSGQQTRESFNRSSRSHPLPNFVFNLKDGIEHTVERLVAEAVLPLFRRLHTERQNWNLALINICVTNMVLAGNEEGTGGGRDISVMFRTQDAKLKQWTAYADDDVDDDDGDELPTEPHVNANSNGVAREQLTGDTASQESNDMEMAVWGESEDEEQDSQKCPDCGHAIPAFAMAAHKRFHALGD
jgi:DNA polymerase iota